MKKWKTRYAEVIRIGDIEEEGVYNLLSSLFQEAGLMDVLEGLDALRTSINKRGISARAIEALASRLNENRWWGVGFCHHRTQSGNITVTRSNEGEVSLHIGLANYRGAGRSIEIDLGPQGKKVWALLSRRAK